MKTELRLSSALPQKLEIRLVFAELTFEFLEQFLPRRRERRVLRPDPSDDIHA